MDNKGLWEKSILSVMGAWVSNKFSNSIDLYIS